MNTLASGHYLETPSLLLLLMLPTEVAVLRAQVRPAPHAETGVFTRVEDATTARSAAARYILTRFGTLDSMASGLNRTYSLPVRLDIVGAECGKDKTGYERG